MIGLVFIFGLLYMFYIETITFFQNRRDTKRITEYFKNIS